MRETILKLYVKSQVVLSTLKDENGQDLIEYALVCALVAFGAVAGMKGLATSINTAFANVGITLTTNT